MDYMEHRWGERLKIELPVRIWTSYGIVGAGRIVDVSVSGALVATALPIALFSPLYVIFPAKRSEDGSTESSRFMAHVVRKAPTGLGIEWFDFATEDLVALTGSRGPPAHWTSEHTSQAISELQRHSS
jgi:hypothetical protein